MPTDEEIQRIIELHESGKSQRDIADEIGKSQPTINNWIKALISKGLINAPDKSRTKSATVARKALSLERRICINSLALEVVETWLLWARDHPTEFKTGAFRDVMVAYGIAEDKRHLLEPIVSESSRGRAAITTYVEAERAKSINEPRAS